MPEAVLAIDQGTTGSTALVLARDGAVLGRATEEFTQFYPEPGWVEHDPEEIWRVSLGVMEAALEEASLAPQQLRAIGITNQRETTLVWDRVTGEPVHPAIVWQSRQTADICEALRADGLEGMITERTGLVVDPYFSGSKIRWILDRYPEARPLAEAGELIFGTVDTWLLYKLTGGAVHATEPLPMPRAPMLYDIRSQRWGSGAAGDLRRPRGDAARGPAELRRFRHHGPLRSSTRWGAGGGHRRRPAGGALRPGLLAAGDGQELLRHRLLRDAQHRFRASPERLRAPHDGLLRRPRPPRPTPSRGRSSPPAPPSSGCATRWASSAARSRPRRWRPGSSDTQGVYVVPAFAGLGAPYWDMHARGAIVGLTRGSGRDQIIRATLDSIAYQTRDVVDAMICDGGEPMRELRADGRRGRQQRPHAVPVRHPRSTGHPAAAPGDDRRRRRLSRRSRRGNVAEPRGDRGESWRRTVASCL